jgi:hypothetical protein
LFRFFELVTHIYRDHPPKNDSTLSEDLDRDDDNALKKACLKAVSDYHTDKKVNKTAGIEWYFLCEEIVKQLNEFYAYFKEF